MTEQLNPPRLPRWPGRSGTILILSCLLFAWNDSAWAQTRLKLSTIIPGTENVQLIYNGDFQFQGAATPTNTHPWPVGWSRQADMFADPATNMVVGNNGVVAYASVTNRASVCKYQHPLTLQPATSYVLSAYLWNMGDSANHATTVIDLSDALNEPQVTLSWSDAGADQGYFVYRSFTTADTGTNIIVRIFYDNPVGAFTASRYYPVAAQWDNIAITRSADFIAPAASGSGANVRPQVRLLSPMDGDEILSPDTPVTLTLTASAADLDGDIVKVEFYSGAAKVGEASASPYSTQWLIPASGAYRLTAVATDSGGATTVSAPVSISATVPATPPQPALQIFRSGPAFSIYWPTSLTSLSLQSAANLAAPDWQCVTNIPVAVSNRFTVTVPSLGPRRFFRLGTAVDPGTLTGKMLLGYQGWFACTNDGAMNRWVHWFDSQTPTAQNVTVDFWPDVSELDPDELFATGMTLQDNSPAYVYAAAKPKTVLRHFKWMKDYNLDGVFLQRFTSELSNPANFGWRNQVASNVWAGAETYGRVFSIMYDISGQNESTLVSTLTNDWLYLVNTMHITNSPRYIRHGGKPVVAVWGFGFTSRTNTPEEAQTVISFFKNAGCTVMGGIPTYWRTLERDSRTNAAWADAYRAFDIISPWSVTRYSTLAGADGYKTNTLLPDLAAAATAGIEYMPVIFPGFSWTNVNGGPLNQVPRQGGTFYWRQVYNAVSAQVNMLYGAMFDELNEGTSMFKMVANAADLPAQGAFVPLNTDGYTNLTSDWYLRLADQASRMLRAEIPLQQQIPISP